MVPDFFIITLTIQFEGPDILKLAIKLYSYEIHLQKKAENFPNQAAYIEHLQTAELKKDIFFRDFNEPPDNWNPKLFREHLSQCKL